MGDVGRAGFLIAAAIGMVHSALCPEALIIVSAFVIDASCTLLSRMLRGRRWYSGHREHLYQWLARTQPSHARVVALYAAWNVLVVAPGLLVFEATDRYELPICAGVYALGIALWLAGKRYCLQNTKLRKIDHVPA